MRYTWSRVAHNVVEHIATPDLYGQPVCDRVLSARTQTFGPRNDNYPMCARCARVLRRIEAAAVEFVAQADRLPMEPTDWNLPGAFVRPFKRELYPLIRDRVNEILAERAAADRDANANGHNWKPVLNDMLKERFPRVCSRCLLREDRPGHDQPCDALAEQARSD